MKLIIIVVLVGLVCSVLTAWIVSRKGILRTKQAIASARYRSEFLSYHCAKEAADAVRAGDQEKAIEVVESVIDMSVSVLWAGLQTMNEKDRSNALLALTDIKQYRSALKANGKLSEPTTKEWTELRRMAEEIFSKLDSRQFEGK